MKEFDFDELDRAVNSLMGDVKKPGDVPSTENTGSSPEQPAAANNAESVVILPETPDEPTPPAPTTAIPPTPPSLPAAPLPTRPSTPILPPRRGGGRFMDVVHPSSDMSSSTSPVSTPTRQGKPLSPITMTDEVKPASPVIDVMAPVTPSPTPKPETAATEDSSVPSDETIAAEPAEPSTSSDPWTSPFLPDTQVEKRPLGGGLPPAPETGLSEAIAAELSKGLPSEEAVTPPSEPDSKDIDDTKAELPAEPAKEVPAAEPETVADTPSPAPELKLNPETETTTMPDELNNDLVAIESGQKSTTLDEETQAPQSSDHSSSAISSTPVTLSAGSIPPQYDEQPSSGDASHTPIYDNEAAAHQPLAHPAKKKKGWVLIIFIVIILAVGGALGALAYFLGLV